MLESRQDGHLPLRAASSPRSGLAALLPVAAILLWSTGAAAQQADRDAIARAPLEAVHFPVSCAEGVQTDFERGLAFLHSFESSEAIRSFRRVAGRDPGCAMAWWGIAAAHARVAWGPAWVEIEPGLAALAQAVEIGGRTQRERAYIEAWAELFEDAESVAWIAHADGDPDRALRLLRDAVATDEATAYACRPTGR